jgi:hypothetical protein
MENGRAGPSARSLRTRDLKAGLMGASLKNSKAEHVSKRVA